MGTTNDTETQDESDTETNNDVTTNVDEYTQVITAETLQNTISYVRALVNEARVHLTGDGLNIRAVDPANVGMVDMSLSPDGFEVYNSLTDTIGLDIERFQNIISMADSDTLITMRFDPETRKLHVSFDGLEYTLALLDPESIRDEPDIPDTDLPGQVTLEQREISRGLTAADMVSDHLTLGIDTDTEEFTVEAEGDTDDVDLRIGEDDYIDLEPADVTSLFSLDYLQDMMMPVDKNQVLTINVGDEFPVDISFEFADGNGTLTFVLAPRISSN